MVRQSNNENIFSEVRVFADKTERAEMEIVNPILFSHLTIFLNEFKSLKYDKAFEVACGECHVTNNILA